jgi:uncharacterized OB-fold protein
MMRLQRCCDCGKSQYPAREFCGTCLSDRIAYDEAATMPARVIARTLLHHSNEPRFRPDLPLMVGLVQFDAGPVAVCFLSPAAAPGDTVLVHLGANGLLEAE